jgi:hypothetical protein
MPRPKKFSNSGETTMMRVPVKYKPVVEAFLQHLDKGYSVPFDHTLLVENIESFQNGTHATQSIPVTDTSLFDDGSIGVGSLLILYH